MDIIQFLAIAMPTLAASIAVGIFLYRTVWPWSQKLVKSMLGMQQLSEAIDKHSRFVELSFAEIARRQDRMDKDLNELTSEFRPNSGESVRDALNRIEYATELSLERQRMTDEDANKMIWESDHLGNIIYVNRTLARFFRRIPGELLGANWINAVHQHDRDRVTELWRDCIEHDREIEIEWTMVTGDESRTEIPIRAKSYIMSDKNKKTIGHYGTITAL